MKKFLTITNKGCKPIVGHGNQAGLWPLKLDCWENRNGVFINHGHLIVNSGQPWAQEFRDLPHEVAGQYEPIPEGKYTPGPLEFASGRWGDYSSEFKEIQSPIWCVIHRTRAIGFHLDGNRTNSPGSAACPVFRSNQDMRTFVDWWEEDPFCMTSVWVEYVNVAGVTLPKGLVIP